MLKKIIFIGILLLYPLSAKTEDLVLQKQDCEDKLAELIGRAESYIDVSTFPANSENGVKSAYSYCIRVFFLYNTNRFSPQGVSLVPETVRGCQEAPV